MPATSRSRALPGETAILDGTGLDIPQHQWGLFTLQNVSYVIVEGFEVRNYTTNSTRDVPIGIFVVGAGSSDQLVNNFVHDITTTAAHQSAQVRLECVRHHGVWHRRRPAAIDGLAVSGNEVSHLHTGCSETLSLDGNVTNWAVVNNLVHDNDNIAIGAIGFERVSKDPAYDQARDGVIRGNTVYNITSFGNPDYGNQYAADGIYVDGGTNIVIEQNRIHNVDLGIELASEHQGRTSSYVIARNNVVYSGNSAGISIGGYAARTGRNRSLHGRRQHALCQRHAEHRQRRVPDPVQRDEQRRSRTIFSTRARRDCSSTISRPARPIRRCSTTISISLPQVTPIRFGTGRSIATRAMRLICRARATTLTRRRFPIRNS